MSLKQGRFVPHDSTNFIIRTQYSYTILDSFKNSFAALKVWCLLRPCLPQLPKSELIGAPMWALVDVLFGNDLQILNNRNWLNSFELFKHQIGGY